MASARGDAGSGRPPKPKAERDGGATDRRAEALRANLKRRRAQIRARGEVRQGDRVPDGHEAPDDPTRDI